MTTEKKVVKGTHLDHPRTDGSVNFILRGGAHNNRVVRLYPFSDGHQTFVWEDETYEATKSQDRAKPFLIARDK